MAYSFINTLVDEGAQILHRTFTPPAPRVFRDRNTHHGRPLDYLWERFRFSRPSIVYLSSLPEPQIRKQTHCSQALTTVQSVCIALCFFACGAFLYNLADAEGLVKATVCQEMRRVYRALKQYLNIFINFPGHLENTKNQGGLLFTWRYVTIKINFK